MKVTRLVFVGKELPWMRRKLTQARHAASYFGAEAVANGDGLNSYKEDIANRYGYKDWDEMPREIRRDALDHYMSGRRAERELDKSK